MTKVKSIDKGKVIDVLNIIILIGLAIHVFDLAISTTTFMMQLPEMLSKILLVVLTLAVTIKVLLSLNNRDMWIALPVAAVYLIVFFSCSYSVMAYLALFTVGLCGINYRKILGSFLVPVSAVLFTSVFASLSGAISNFVIADGNIKSAFGSSYYSEFASALVFLLLFFWIFLKNIPDVFFLIPGAFVLFVSFYITGAKTATLLSVIFLCFIIYKLLEDKYFVSSSKLFVIKRVANAVVRFAFPVLFIFMVIMLMLFRQGTKLAQSYDAISAYRLLAPSKMIDAFGIKPFGSFFEMAGNGWSVFEVADYTFIDSSYLLLLIRYGLVTALFVSVIWVWMSDKVLRSGNRRMAFAMLFIAIDSLSEHHLMEINFNILLAMPFAYLGTVEENVDAKLSAWLGDEVTRKFRTTQFLSLTVGIIVLFFFLPMIFSFYRTIFNGYGLCDADGIVNGPLVFVLCLLTLCIISGFFWCFSKLIASDALDRSIDRKYLLLTIGFAVIMLVVFVVEDGLVNNVYRAKLPQIAGEAEVISDMTAFAKGKVYVDRYPEAYKKQFAGIDRSFFDGEDIARLRDVTLIVDSDFDSLCFENRGFSYTQISDYDGIYTNDKGVIDALGQKGYAFSAFNNSAHKLDLHKVARRNGLGISDEESLQLSGKEHSLVFGPFLDLNPGDYSVSFCLELADESQGKCTGNAASIGTVRVSSDWGKNIYDSYELSPDMFDESGKLIYETAFTGGERGYEFLVFLNDGQNLELDGITYRRLN